MQAWFSWYDVAIEVKNLNATLSLLRVEQDHIEKMIQRQEKNKLIAERGIAFLQGRRRAVIASIGAKLDKSLHHYNFRAVKDAAFKPFVVDSSVPASAAVVGSVPSTPDMRKRHGAQIRLWAQNENKAAAMSVSAPRPLTKTPAAVAAPAQTNILKCWSGVKVSRESNSEAFASLEKNGYFDVAMTRSASSRSKTISGVISGANSSTVPAPLYGVKAKDVRVYFLPHSSTASAGVVEVLAKSSSQSEIILADGKTQMYNHPRTTFSFAYKGGQSCPSSDIGSNTDSGVVFPSPFGVWRISSSIPRELFKSVTEVVIEIEVEAMANGTSSLAGTSIYTQSNGAPDVCVESLAAMSLAEPLPSDPFFVTATNMIFVNVAVGVLVVLLTLHRRNQKHNLQDGALDLMDIELAQGFSIRKGAVLLFGGAPADCLEGDEEGKQMEKSVMDSARGSRKYNTIE